MCHLCKNISKGVGDILLTFIEVELLYYVLLVSAVRQSESAIRMYISLFFGFSSHLGHHRALNKAPCAIQKVHYYLFHTWYCIYVSLN